MIDCVELAFLQVLEVNGGSTQESGLYRYDHYIGHTIAANLGVRLGNWLLCCSPMYNFQDNSLQLLNPYRNKFLAPLCSPIFGRSKLLGRFRIFSIGIKYLPENHSKINKKLSTNPLWSPIERHHAPFMLRGGFSSY